MNPASARYVLASFAERITYGVKQTNPYNKLFEERIIFVGMQIRDRFLTADEAKEYGLVDEVLTSRKEATELVLR